MLDTNTPSDPIRDPRGPLVQRLSASPPDALCTGIVVACELRFACPAQGLGLPEAACGAVARPSDGAAAGRAVDQHYAEIRVAREQAGRPIGSHDLLIAAHARSRDLTLVTHNLREFQRVPGLLVGNGVGAPG